MSTLSIVTAVLGNPQRFEEGLVTVLEHRPVGAQVVVVLGQPYDDPYDLSDEVSFVQFDKKRPSLVDCFRAGLEAATGDVVHFLAPGLEVAEDWAKHALECFEDPHVAAVIPHCHRVDGEATVTTIGIGYRAGGGRYEVAEKKARKKPKLPIGPELGAGFYRRAALHEVGGLPRGLGDQLADVDVAISLRHAGYTVAVAQDCHIAASTPVGKTCGAFRSGLYAERLFLRNIPQHGWCRALLAHPFAVAFAAITGGPMWSVPFQLLGRAVAWLQLPGCLKRHQELAEATQARASEVVHRDVPQWRREEAHTGDDEAHHRREAA